MLKEGIAVRAISKLLSRRSSCHVKGVLQSPISYHTGKDKQIWEVF